MQVLERERDVYEPNKTHSFYLFYINCFSSIVVNMKANTKIRVHTIAHEP